MAATMTRMAQGSDPGPAGGTAPRESGLAIGPPLALGLVTLMLGMYLPPSLDAVLHRAAQALGAG
jgi:hypothetical protein